jgi:hypothetical protein
MALALGIKHGVFQHLSMLDAKLIDPNGGFSN